MGRLVFRPVGRDIGLTFLMDAGKISSGEGRCADIGAGQAGKEVAFRGRLVREFDSRALA